MLTTTRGTVKYRLFGQQHIATWEVEGRTICVTALVGSFRVALGLDHPEKLTRRLLKSYCARQERMAPTPVIATTGPASAPSVGLPH